MRPTVLVLPACLRRSSTTGEATKLGSIRASSSRLPTCAPLSNGFFDRPSRSGWPRAPPCWIGTKRGRGTRLQCMERDSGGRCSRVAARRRRFAVSHASSPWSLPSDTNSGARTCLSRRVDYASTRWAHHYPSLLMSRKSVTWRSIERFSVFGVTRYVTRTLNIGLPPSSAQTSWSPG
ncbi:MAG: hypothetical protein JWM93_1806 [Frankiales bacterium]|nr:hypothetical protein [Frankiales bacterium]